MKICADYWSTLLILILIKVFSGSIFYFKSDEDVRLKADCYKNAEWVYDYYQEFNGAMLRIGYRLYWRRKPLRANTSMWMQTKGGKQFLVWRIQ
ncbi:MAG: hypothetical protein R2764_22720 [Bacteroidales bacterium]